jgi:hypothetical protein
VKPPKALSPRSRALWTELHSAYDFTVADEAILERALESYDVHDSLMKSARRAGVDSKDARALLGAARDASLVALRHWAALGFAKIDLATRGPGRPSRYSTARRNGHPA